MILIYIRHFYKQYSNRQSTKYPYDPDIINDQHNIICKVGNKLVKKYGMPHIIFSSPYKRTRKTAKILKKCLDVPIIIDNDLSEFINHKYDIVLEDSVRETTKLHNPPINETTHQFHERMKNHREKIKNLLDDGVYWFVTHGLNIKNILNVKYPSQLSSVIWDDGEIKTYSYKQILED
jgi:broad specificity phosphatase PhoE